MASSQLVGEVWGNLAGGFAGLSSGLKNAGNTLKDYKERQGAAAEAEQKAQEAEDSLFQSNQYKLETAYRKGLGTTMQSLPESTDFNSYNQRVKDFNAAFVSDAKASGIYDERTLTWLESEFIPKQSTQTEQAVDGVKNFAIYTWLATAASSQANVFAADSTLSVDAATAKYKEYYDRVGLGNIPNGANDYGIFTPDEFKEAIRGTKALQAFQRISANIETGYLFSSDYDMNAAMKQAKAEAGYNPDIIQEAQFQGDCNKVLANIENAIQSEVNNLCQQVEAIYNDVLTSADSRTTAISMTEAYEAARSYPSQYIGKFVDLAAKIEKHNSDVQYNVATDAIARGQITDAVLSMLDAGYQSTHEERFRTAREEAVTSRILKEARLNGSNDSSKVMDYIYNGEFGITVTADDRYRAAAEFYSSLKSAYDTISNYSDLVVKVNADRTAGSPVPDMLSALYDVEVTYTTTDEDGNPQTVTETEQIQNVQENKYPDNATFVFTPKFELTFKGEQNVPLAEKKIFESETPAATTETTPEPETTAPAIGRDAQPTVTSGAPEQTEEQAETAGSTRPEALPTATTTTPEQKPTATSSGTTTAKPTAKSDLPGVYTASALNELTEQQSEVAAGGQVIDNQQARTEFEAMAKRGAPQAILNAMARYYEDNGLLSENTIASIVNQKSWRESENWDILNLSMDTLLNSLDVSPASSKNIKKRVTDQVAEAFRYSGQTWDEFEKNLTKLIDMLTTEEIMSETMSHLETFNKVAQDADSYYETLTSNGMYGQLFQDYANGKFDGLVNYGLIQKVQDMNIVGNDAIRNEFAKLMNHESYETALQSDPTGMTKLMIETMTAIVNMHNEAGEFYQHVTERLNEYGIPATLLDFTVDPELGYVFVDSNSAQRGYALCIDPELMVYDTKSGLSAQWKYAPVIRSQDGTYKIDRSRATGDMGQYAQVGSNLFLTTADKPAEDMLSGEWASEVEETARTAAAVNQSVGMPSTDYSWLAGKIAQIFQRKKTKDYVNQSANEEATFIDAYKTAFGLWEN